MAMVVVKPPVMRFVYSDDHRHILEIGSPEILRASHVEPCGTKWTADLSPVGGPFLGPFDEREEAIEKELEWLNSHLGEINI